MHYIYRQTTILLLGQEYLISTVYNNYKENYETTTFLLEGTKIDFSNEQFTAVTATVEEALALHKEQIDNPTIWDLEARPNKDYLSEFTWPMTYYKALEHICGEYHLVFLKQALHPSDTLTSEEVRYGARCTLHKEVTKLNKIYGITDREPYLKEVLYNVAGSNYEG